MTKTDLTLMGRQGQAASRILATLPTEQKNAALRAIAAGLRQETPALLPANEEDVSRARAAGLQAAIVDRLLLTPERIQNIAADVEHVASLPRSCAAGAKQRAATRLLARRSVRRYGRVNYPRRSFR